MLYCIVKYSAVQCSSVYWSPVPYCCMANVPSVIITALLFPDSHPIHCSTSVLHGIQYYASLCILPYPYWGQTRDIWSNIALRLNFYDNNFLIKLTGNWVVYFLWSVWWNIPLQYIVSVNIIQILVLQWTNKTLSVPHLSLHSPVTAHKSWQPLSFSLIQPYSAILTYQFSLSHSHLAILTHQASLIHSHFTILT